MKIVSFIPIKLNNQRLPGKNTMLLQGRPTCDYIFDTISKVDLIDEKYELKILNECVCIVDYQMDGSSTNMYRQYVRNPKGFAFWRKEQMKHSINTKQKIKACIHYVSSSLIAKNKHFIKESPEKFLTVLSVPLGFLLKIIVVKKSKSSYMKVEGI